MVENMNKTTQSIQYAERQQALVTAEQRTVLDGIIERLESWDVLTVTTVSPVWYIIEGLDKKVQLEVDNPGGNLDIVEITEDDSELLFPRKGWIEESAKLSLGNEDFAERKIVAKFALTRNS